MDKLLIATNNQGKIEEITRYLSIPNLKIYSYSQWQNENKIKDSIPDPEEDGSTYYDNAVIKAKAAFQWASIPVLADDSGIELRFLGGRPGVNTARYAGVGCSSKDNVNKMLKELLVAEERTAQYISCLVFYDGKELKSFKGVFKGKIAQKESGDGGFGYDPIFIPEGYDETLASLKTQSVLVATHRMMAMEKFKEFYIDAVKNV